MQQAMLQATCAPTCPAISSASLLSLQVCLHVCTTLWACIALVLVCGCTVSTLCEHCLSTVLVGHETRDTGLDYVLAASMSSITALAVLSSRAALAVFHLLLLMLKLFCVLSHARARARTHTHTHCKHRECAGGYGHRHKRQRGLHYRCPHLRTHARTLYDKKFVYVHARAHVCVCVCVCLCVCVRAYKPQHT